MHTVVWCLCVCVCGGGVGVFWHRLFPPETLPCFLKYRSRHQGNPRKATRTWHLCRHATGGPVRLLGGDLQERGAADGHAEPWNTTSSKEWMMKPESSAPSQQSALNHLPGPLATFCCSAQISITHHMRSWATLWCFLPRVVYPVSPPLFSQEHFTRNTAFLNW